MCVKRGVRAVVIEQGSRPYGKIEGGLPRWHGKLRRQEYGRIDRNLSMEGVRFVPETKLGVDISLDALRELGFSAVLLATGSWRDRPLPIEGIDAFVGSGLLYQNPFIIDFNRGALTDAQLPEGAIVVGGGLASVDVAKVLSLETHVRALRAQGHEVSVDDLEVRGIPAWCEANGVDMPEVRPPTIFYRRGMDDMSVASVPKGASDEVVAKVRRARVKIMTRIMERYRVAFEAYRSPVAPISEGGKLSGLVFAETAVVDGRVKTTDTHHEVAAPLVVSSIGSIPVPIEGVPMKGELYDYESWDTGALRGLERVYGLGNVLTGRGNIKDSRKSGRTITELVLAEQREGEDARRTDEAEIAMRAKEAVARVLDAALGVPEASAADVARIDAWIERRWREVGYPADYGAWVATQRAEPKA